MSIYGSCIVGALLGLFFFLLLSFPAKRKQEKWFFSFGNSGSFVYRDLEKDRKKRDTKEMEQGNRRDGAISRARRSSATLMRAREDLDELTSPFGEISVTSLAVLAAAFRSYLLLITIVS